MYNDPAFDSHCRLKNLSREMPTARCIKQWKKYVFFSCEFVQSDKNIRWKVHGNHACSSSCIFACGCLVMMFRSQVVL